MSFPSPIVVLRNGLRVLVPVAAALTIYLYLYPVFNLYSFPLPPAPRLNGKGHRISEVAAAETGLPAFLETLKLHIPILFGDSLPSTVEASGNGTTAGSSSRLAPFRLLALGDPQLEGDTSIPNAYSSSIPHLTSLVDRLAWRTSHSSLRDRVRDSLHDVVDFYFDDIPNMVESARKRIDLFGNDFYLAHIYRTLRWWTLPTHVTVLGDLLGSQWIGDEEFERRGARYWNRAFRGGERLPDELMAFPAADYDLAGFLGVADDDAAVWTKRVINVAGNHDIGYAGDINMERLSRFERLFGKANYELRFELAPSALSPSAVASVFDEVTNPDSNRLMPEFRIVVLNDMNLDTPALSTEIQDQTYSFLNAVINTASAVEFEGQFTLLLTHVPLYKPEGICVDPPFFAFHNHDGSLKEQNQLSSDASQGFLEGVFGLSGDTMAPNNGRGRNGVILNGHDHEGCDTYHFINQSQGQSMADRDWDVWRWPMAKEQGIVQRPDIQGLREITVRSMMGDFGGNAGLLSVWFDEDAWEWRFELANCPLGTQHLWWTVHIIDLITLVAGLSYLALMALATAGIHIGPPTICEKSRVMKGEKKGTTNGHATPSG